MTAEDSDRPEDGASRGCDRCGEADSAHRSAAGRDDGESAVDRERGPGADADVAGTAVDAGGGASDERLRLSVPEMDCPTCAGKVEAALSDLDGVEAVDPRPTSGALFVGYDPDRVTPDGVADRVEAAGYAVEAGETVSLSVPAMDCPSCAGKVESALAGIQGVTEFDARPTAGRVVVTFDPERASRGRVVAAIEGAGYEVVDGERDAGSPHDVWRSVRALKTWTGAALLVAGIAFGFLLPGDPLLFAALGREVTVSWAAFVLAAAVAGQEVLRNGYYSLRNRNLDIDLLMSAGIVGALAVDLPFEAATLAVLFSIAELLERFSMDRARTSMRELMELSPDTATVLRGGGPDDRGEERVVPAEDVAVGETVVVRPGEKVPLDGVVREGQSAVDESPITGESVPVDVKPGDEVYAGSILAEGYLEVEATAPASESTLARVVEMVEDAQRDKTESERFIDRFARYYTPIIVAGALATTFVPPLLFGAPFEEWFRRGLTLLVVACPCAFVISTPVTVVSGITSAARNGVLVKGGDRLEAMGEVDAVAFDKTGTLTRGELGVTDVVPLNGRSESEVLACAAALESRSEHPIAAAIVDHAADRGAAGRGVSNFESITGKGVRADLVGDDADSPSHRDGRTHYAGKPALFEELGFDLGHTHVDGDGANGGAVTDGGRMSDGGQVVDPDECEHGAYVDLASDVVPRLESEGKTVVLVGTEDELEGVIAIADTVRPEAEWVVSRLREAGVRTVMLTGDNARTAEVIGDRVGVDVVHADLLPEEKVEALERLADAHGSVAMVGDGVNDAPALATATVGIAMGAAGTDTALETADVALMADDLTRLPYLLDLSRKAGRIIRQNVWSSLAVKAALAIGAPLGLVSVIHAVVVGDMGMSLTVTGNAMRLANESPDSPEFEGAEDGTRGPDPDREHRSDRAHTHDDHDH
jgi:Cd2+/Zn2+-exporting ATPase